MHVSDIKSQKEEGCLQILFIKFNVRKTRNDSKF